MLCLSTSQSEIFARDLVLIDIAFLGTVLARSLALEWRDDVLVTREIGALLAEGIGLSATVVDEATNVAAHRALEFEASELLDVSRAFSASEDPSRLRTLPMRSPSQRFTNVQLSNVVGKLLADVNLADYDHVRFLFSIQPTASRHLALGYAISSGKAKKLLDLSLMQPLAIRFTSRA
jgi:hypothetical protein